MGAFVDQGLCVGCGLCEAICPEVFRMNDVRKAETYADTTDMNYDTVMKAVEGCPVSAIREE